MKVIRKLIVDPDKKFVAVQYTDSEGNDLTTPFYLEQGKSIACQWFDQEEIRWLKTTVRISDDGRELFCIDDEGFEWQSPFLELLDSKIVRFINQSN